MVHLAILAQLAITHTKLKEHRKLLDKSQMLDNFFNHDNNPNVKQLFKQHKRINR
jgi:hypothetical protein